MVIYGQRDYPDTLGTSNVTIAGYGCAVTSVCMLLEYCGIHVTPPQLNTWLTNNQGYANGNLIKWDAVNRFTGGVVTFLKAGSTDRYPCIAEVDLLPTNSQFDQHFVLALDKEWCLDPWEKRKRLLSDFKGAKSFRVYQLPEVAMDELERLRREADEARKARDENWNLYQAERAARAGEVLALNQKVEGLSKTLQTVRENAEAKASADAEVISALSKRIELLEDTPVPEQRGALEYLSLFFRAAVQNKWS